VKTSKLKESFSKYLPAVMDNDVKARAKVLNESRSEVTGDKDTQEVNSGIDEMRKLAGI
jgi:putative component of toxin-antitoxin plasmid stabilization module